MNMQGFKEFISDKKAEVATVSSSIVASGAMAPVLAFADDPATVSGTLTSGVAGAVTEAQNAILAVLPQALILMGVVLGITVGIRLFKRIGK